MNSKYGYLALATLIAFSTVLGTASAQGEGTTGGDSALAGVGGIAIGAGLAIGLAGLGTGLAQKDIGAAAVGAIAENPSFLAQGIVFVAIPETIVIFGFVVAFLLSGRIPAA